MPQEPKRRHSKQRKGKRRASIKLKTQKGVYCSNCGVKTLSHMVCKKCGFYKGREILTIKQKEKKEEKSKP